MAYTRYYTVDRFDRRIAFYIDGDQGQRLPIVVSVLGSGAFSNFIRRGDRILDAHRTAREAFAGRAHILIVEKPGVDFLEQHPDRGTALQASETFRREHTLERWSEAVSAALRAARGLSLSDNSRCVLVGHSEGGIVVARVAAENPFVTHVAVLAGGGPTQLFDLLEDARAGRLYTGMAADADQQVARLLSDVAAIRSSPDDPDRMFLGHPFRRWSSFLASSTLEELQRTSAHIFIAQGTADRNVSPLGPDVLYAGLLARGRDVTAHRIAGADHGFAFADQPGRDGWKEVFEEIRTWWFR
jgi:pimeloyl-ACP methyl ester carboxylesterase